MWMWMFNWNLDLCVLWSHLGTQKTASKRFRFRWWKHFRTSAVPAFYIIIVFRELFSFLCLFVDWIRFGDCLASKINSPFDCLLCHWYWSLWHMVFIQLGFEYLISLICQCQTLPLSFHDKYYLQATFDSWLYSFAEFPYFYRIERVCLFAILLLFSVYGCFSFILTPK